MNSSDGPDTSLLRTCGSKTISIKDFGTSFHDSKLEATHGQVISDSWSRISNLRGPEDRINIRILNPGSKAQDMGEIPKVMVCGSIMCMWSFGPLNLKPSWLLALHAACPARRTTQVKASVRWGVFEEWSL